MGVWPPFISRIPMAGCSTMPTKLVPKEGSGRIQFSLGCLAQMSLNPVKSAKTLEKGGQYL